jgi:hypothetical protein
LVVRGNFVKRIYCFPRSFTIAPGMNTNTLSQWLELPPGPWPPDDRTLLGLPATFTSWDVESRALAQMEKLRPHQLMQPELVTEGMNRLAQALDNLTRESAPRPTLPTQPTASAEDAAIILDADLLGKKRPPVPTILEAEVVSVPAILQSEPKRSPRPAKKKKPPRSKKVEAENEDAPATVPLAEVVPPGVAYSPKDRRKGYAELVALRRVMRNWEKLQPFFAAPSEKVETPSVVFGFLEAVRDCRQSVAVDADREWFERDGQRVLKLIRSPFCLSVFRSLVRSQRRDLATDWAAASAHLRGRYLGLREELRSTVPRNVWKQSLNDFATVFRSHPEWLMFLLIALAIGVAVLRMVIGKP